MRLFHNIQTRGLGWFFRRLAKEFYAPTTKPGRAFRPMNKFIVEGFVKRLSGKNDGTGFEADDDTLYAFYDLEIEPITYDFATFLMLANCRRQLLGLGRLYIVFVPGKSDGLREELPDYEDICGVEHRKWRITNILLPMTQLVPSCRGYAWCQSRKQAEGFAGAVHAFPIDYDVTFPVYTRFADWRVYYDQGADLGVFEAPQDARRYVQDWLSSRAGGRDVVTITLRHYAYMTDRNSNLEAWSEAAKELNRQGYFVVIVPDMDQAIGGLPDAFAAFAEFSEACWNLQLRMALYQDSFQNLFVNGGPASLCYFSTINYLMFKVVTPSVPQATEEQLRQRNLAPGENPPFAGRGQKWIWEDDEPQIIAAAFREMKTQIRSLRD